MSVEDLVIVLDGDRNWSHFNNGKKLKVIVSKHDKFKHNLITLFHFTNYVDN